MIETRSPTSQGAILQTRTFNFRPQCISATKNAFNFKGELTSKMIFPPLIREVISIVLLQI